MCAVRIWFLLSLALSAVCGGPATLPEDRSMDTVLELLLEELELEAASTEDEPVEGKLMRQVDDEWRCGKCDDFSRLLYLETTDIQLGTAQAESHAEIQVGLELEERMSCVRVRGVTSPLLTAVIVGGSCAGASVTLALRSHAPPTAAAQPHTVKLYFYG